MKYSDLTPQEKRLAFLLELAIGLERHPEQFVPPVKNEKGDTPSDDT